MTRPTIEDVARLAGVSTATVSRCLHTPDLLTPATRDRVLTAVRTTGYTLNTAAQSLRQRRANTVLVVVPDIGNTFYSEVLVGIDRVASAAAMTMLIGDTRLTQAREESLVRYLLNGRADGALLLTGPRPAWAGLPRVNAAGVRPVVILSEADATSDMVSVTIDNHAAARAAVAHLIALGHRRIAHLTGPAGTILMQQRLQGYRQALADAGLPPDPDLELPGDYSLTSGHAALDRIRRMADTPTALFCANDESALGFISAAHLGGVRVPQDISVVGFDDIHFAQSGIPALTTIRQPRADMGAIAMGLLLEIIAGKAPASVCLPHDLVLRASTAPPGRDRSANPQERDAAPHPGPTR
jgi:LacI family repressor for deo operon, udp, cdd, tsx, nupC, and nupG